MLPLKVASPYEFFKVAVPDGMRPREGTLCKVCAVEECSWVLLCLKPICAWGGPPNNPLELPVEAVACIPVKLLPSGAFRDILNILTLMNYF